MSIAQVEAFKEKPDAATAERFVASGDYFWNSGIFVWKAATILKQLKANCPDIFAAVEVIAEAWGTPDQVAVFRTEYEGLRKVSIDFAVMEKAPQVMVIQAPYQWDDVGSWLALERRNPQDADGNTVQAQHTGIGTSNCVIVGDPDKLITTINVRDLLIVQDGDAVLVANRSDEAAVKELVDQIKARGLGRFL